MTESILPRGLAKEFTPPRPGSHTSVEILDGATMPLAAADFVRRCRGEGRMAAVICADAAESLQLADEIAWLDPDISHAVFPDWETLPYDTMSPHRDLVSERLETLWRLAMRGTAGGTDLLIASAVTAAQRIAPKSFITANTFFFDEGERVDLERLKSTLAEAGYGRVETVMAPGEFCVRGGIVDIYPMGSSEPFRLDLFDDEIDSIRRFDTETQHSTERCRRIRVLPGHEFPVTPEAVLEFRRRWRATFSGDPAQSPVYQDIGNGIAAAGIEYYLPLFFNKTETLADYLPESCAIAVIGNVEAAINRFMRETSDRFGYLRHDTRRPVLPPETICDSAVSFFTGISSFGRVSLKPPAHPSSFDLVIDRRAADPAARLRRFLEDSTAAGRRVLVTAASEGRTERIGELLAEGGVSVTRPAGLREFMKSGSRAGLVKSPLLGGIDLADPPLSIVTENELYSARPQRRRTRIKESPARAEAVIRDISEMKPGDPVVHVEHGIGRYQGLETIQSQEGPSEFVRIDYADDARLFVPVSQLHLISRYTGGDAEHAPLHHLGRGEWERAKRKAAQKVRDTAAELLHLYALRETRSGIVFEQRAADYEAFREGFQFEETPDQKHAIEAVIADMVSGKPMDRLICGDVGFGKTEVALRAAFIAAMNGRQTAVLCPTTLLAEQHSQTFRDRFANWPVKIAELSRFRSGRETAQVLEGIKNGTVDIVIGTHKLLGEKVEFARLGLVVIDEEHRFGVRQKERLKSLRAEVDVLTLTATPIPRTLSMSLEGIRDFSVIATAPEKRLAIKTFVRREAPGLIREAVLRELKRGGQVYYLHNEVETIMNCRERLEALLPEARIAVAHGQMGERDLEHVMREFYRQRYNVLICSTIIETGIDVPNANTIIIHRADKFGLAQLHQLRGRVGRSHHQAYAYLMIPSEESLTKNAQKRLDAIQSMEELGSGFYLSMHDLEIRGAGEVLGDEQSGEITKVGFELYSQMLKNAVASLKKGVEPALEHPFAAFSEINLHMPALLPEDYVPDVASRLAFYKDLAASDTSQELDRAAESLADRCGRLPEAARALIAAHRLRITCRRLGIRKIDASKSAVVFTFSEKPDFDPARLVALMQSRRDLRMMGQDRLRLAMESADLDGRLRAVRLVLNAIDTGEKS